MNFQNLINLLAKVLAELAEVFKELAELIAVLVSLRDSGQPQIPQLIKNKIRENARAATPGITETATLREAPEVEHEAPEQHKHDVQREESKAEHEVLEWHEAPKAGHQLEVRYEVSAIKHVMPEQHKHDVRHEEFETEHEVLERHKAPKAGHEFEAQHKAPETKPGVHAFSVSGTGGSILPSINVRLYSIMTASISSAHRKDAAFETRKFTFTYSTHPDPAQNIAKTLLENMNSPKYSPTKIAAVRHPDTMRSPNMSHSFSSMFVGMPTASSRLEVE